MIEVRCLHALTEAEPFRAQINTLNRASPRPDPFSDFSYYQTCLGNLMQFGAAGEALRLWLLLAFRDGELIGYLALKHCRQRIFGLRVGKLDLLTAHIADRPHLVARGEDEDVVGTAFYDYLLSRRSEWSLLEFQQQDTGSALLRAPAETDRGLLQQRHWPNMANGTITVNWRSTSDYFAALSKKSRSNVGRQMRSLLAAGEVEVLSSSDAGSRSALFELYQSIEPQSWKTAAGGAIGSDPQRLAYYWGLMQADQAMQIHVQVLLLDGVPIAGLISGSFGRGLYALHIVYDDRAAQLAPGSAIFWMGMRLAIEGGYQFFDLLWGFGYYKTRWLAEMSETRSLQIYRIDRPYFWRRALGDVRRRYLGGKADEDTTQFNPARQQREPTEHAEDLSPQQELADAGQRRRYAELRSQVCAGEGEFLSSTALAATMPFETKRRASALATSALTQKASSHPTMAGVAT